MNISTKYFGELAIDEQDMIHFESGLPGFIDEKSYIVLPLDEASPFFILQSTKTPQLAFVMVSPFIVDQHYDFKIPDSIVQGLKLTSEEEVAVYVILTVNEPFESSTVNLKAPVIINTISKLGKQLVLNDADYQIKHPLDLQKTSNGQEG